MEDKIRKRLEEEINNLDIEVSQKFLGDDGESAIAIDENNKRLGIITNNHKNTMVLSPTFSQYDYSHHMFEYQDILKSEILMDGTSITSTSAVSSVSGAILGGVLAGGVGAIVGGLSGEKETTNVPKKSE